MKVILDTEINNISKKSWDGIAVNKDFLISYDFLKITEAEHINEITPLYIRCIDKGKTVGVLYAQIFKLNGRKLKEYIANSNSQKSIPHLIKSKFAQLLNFEVAFLGNLFLTNEYSYHFIDGYSINQFLNKITESITIYTKAKFILIPSYFKNSIDILGANVKKIKVEPDMTLNISESWTSFEDYLFTIKSKYKKRYRKVLKNSKPIHKKELSSTDLKLEESNLKTLFFNVYSKSKFNAVKFNTNVYYDLKLIYENVKIYGYYYNNKLIGFQTDIEANDILYAHFVGIDYDLNEKLDLYNRMLYEQIDYAIRADLKKIKFGRTASEFKSTIGALPTNDFGYIYHPSKSLLITLGPILRLIKPKKWVKRNPFK